MISVLKRKRGARRVGLATQVAVGHHRHAVEQPLDWRYYRLPRRRNATRCRSQRFTHTWDTGHAARGTHVMVCQPCHDVAASHDETSSMLLGCRTPQTSAARRDTEMSANVALFAAAAVASKTATQMVASHKTCSQTQPALLFRVIYIKNISSYCTEILLIWLGCFKQRFHILSHISRQSLLISPSIDYK